MRRRIAHGLAIAFLIVGLGAAQGPNISEAKPAPGSSVQPKSEARKQVGKTKPYQVGTASWYGQNFQGKPTASGEPYEMYDMTAASLTLPMGSYVRVTNLRNGKAVVVRINDRGPVVPGRIIDLSYGAARALQMKAHGLQRVRLDLVQPTSVAKAPTSKPYQTIAYNHPPVAQLP
jgi:rare lipoprotein A